MTFLANVFPWVFLAEDSAPFAARNRRIVALSLRPTLTQTTHPLALLKTYN